MRRISPSALVLAIALGVPAAARAQAGQLEGTVELPPRNYLNLRAGASSGNRNGHPELCMEVSPVDRFSVEACGTGAGFLHRDEGQEISHYRARYRLFSRSVGPSWMLLHVAGGFAELQVGEDSPGFHFTNTGPLGTETAGPELGLAATAMLPLAGGVELLGQLNAGAAYFPYATRLVLAHDVLQPTVGLSLGFGF